MKIKINWLLILQGWAMLWVVIGHSPLSLDNMPAYVENLHKIAYSFHMPLFIAISGYLFQLTKLSRLNGSMGWVNYAKIIKDKLIRLGIPFLVFTFIAMVVKVMFPGDMARQTSLNVQEFLMAIINPFDGPLNEMWFVLTILWFFAFAPIWFWACKHKESEFALLGILVLLHFFHPNLNMLCIRQVCSQAVFFYSGILICKYSLDEVGIRKRWHLLIGGLIAYVICFTFNISFVIIWGAIAFSAGLAFILDEYLPKTFFTFRNYTYQIFLISIFVQIAVKMVYKRVEMPYIVGYLICIAIGLYVPVIISKILEKINWQPLLLCVGLKKK